MTTTGGERVGVLIGAWFLVDFDLAVLNPLLVPVSHGLGVGLAAATWALTAYLLLFGLMQPVYGVISDAVGRVRVLRVALAAWGVANLIAATAPDVVVLIVGRALAGACAAAVVPATAAYVGDRFAPQRLQRIMALLLSAGAVGAAAATIVAGSLTQLIGWRAPLVVVAVAAPAVAVWCGRLPEAVPPSRSVTVGERLGQAVAGGWLRFLIAFLFIEGAAMIGFYSFFNASLQVNGDSALIAGAVTSSYGAAAICGGLTVRALHERASPAAMFGGGVLLLTIGYGVAAAAQTVTTILIASICAGFALALAQSTVQAWVLHVAPADVRGTATSLVACSVFTGAAIGVAALGGVAGSHEFRALFLVAAAVSVVVGIVGTVALTRYHRVVAGTSSA
jgi:MFS family permease